MNRLDGILAGAIVLVGLVLITWLGVLQYGEAQHAAGYAAAVEDGKEAKRRADEAARKTETILRARLLERDTDALKKEHEHAESLAAAQRRIRSGTDGLRCPAGPVPARSTADDRSTASGSAADGPGPAIVPEVAAEILGDAAAIAGLVRRYERLEQRFDECEALTKTP